MPEIDRLEDFLKRYRSELTEKVMKLISEDAPKNKFSIVTGELRMIEETQSQIDLIKRERESKGS